TRWRRARPPRTSRTFALLRQASWPLPFGPAAEARGEEIDEGAHLGGNPGALRIDSMDAQLGHAIALEHAPQPPAAQVGRRVERGDHGEAHAGGRQLALDVAV